VYAHVNVGVFTRTSNSLSPPGGFDLFSANGALVDAWPYFPGLKVGQMFLYSPFDDCLLVMLIINRYTVS